MVTFTFTTTAFAEDINGKTNVLIRINGAYLIHSNGTMPYVGLNNRVMVPARIITDALGGSLIWDTKQNLLTINTTSLKIVSQLGKKSVEINGKVVSSDSEMVMKNGTMMIPFNWIAKGLGVTLNTNSKYKVFSINHSNFFSKGKLELMNDETGKDYSAELNVIPLKLSYKDHKNLGLKYLNIEFVNDSDTTYTTGLLQDHLIAPVNKDNFYNTGSKGELINDQSTITSIPEIKPNQHYVHEIKIQELSKLVPDKAQYAFLRYFKKMDIQKNDQ